MIIRNSAGTSLLTVGASANAIANGSVGASIMSTGAYGIAVCDMSNT